MSSMQDKFNYMLKCLCEEYSLEKAELYTFECYSIFGSAVLDTILYSKDPLSKYSVKTTRIFSHRGLGLLSYALLRDGKVVATVRLGSCGMSDIYVLNFKGILSMRKRFRASMSGKDMLHAFHFLGRKDMVADHAISRWSEFNRKVDSEIINNLKMEEPMGDAKSLTKLKENEAKSYGVLLEDLSFKKRYLVRGHGKASYKLLAIYNASEYSKAQGSDVCLTRTDTVSTSHVYIKVSEMKEIPMKTLMAYVDDKGEVHWFTTKPSATEIKRRKLTRDEASDNSFYLS